MSVINCLIMSDDWQFHLVMLLLRSMDGSMTVLKSPPMMIGQLELLEMDEKKL